MKEKESSQHLRCFYANQSFYQKYGSQHANQKNNEDGLAVLNKNYLALVFQTRMTFLKNLEEFNISSTWEEAVQATSLTLLAQVLANKEINSYSIQSTFDLATNLSFWS